MPETAITSGVARQRCVFDIHVRWVGAKRPLVGDVLVAKQLLYLAGSTRTRTAIPLRSPSHVHCVCGAATRVLR